MVPGRQPSLVGVLVAGWRHACLVRDALLSLAPDPAGLGGLTNLHGKVDFARRLCTGVRGGRRSALVGVAAPALGRQVRVVVDDRSREWRRLERGPRGDAGGAPPERRPAQEESGVLTD